MSSTSLRSDFLNIVVSFESVGPGAWLLGLWINGATLRLLESMGDSRTKNRGSPSDGKTVSRLWAAPRETRFLLDRIDDRCLSPEVVGRGGK